MQKKITVTIPDDMVADLRKLVREEGCSGEEIALNALKRLVAVKRLQRLRAKMVPHAQKMGIYTDQDVFDRVS